MLGWVVRSACSRAAVSVAAVVARHDCSFFFSALYSLLSLLLAVEKCKPCCIAGVALFQLLLPFWFLLLLQIAVLLQTLLLLLHVMFVVIVLLFDFL